MSSRGAGRRVVVGLSGGLGNQMFQYAAGRGLAAARSADLVLDTHTGFARDRVFRRTYALEPFPIRARAASPVERWPFWFERMAARVSGGPARFRTERPWGTVLTEEAHTPADASIDVDAGAVFLRGYWQTERHFAALRALIAAELAPPAPGLPALLETATALAAPNAVVVGVRLFEELPGDTKEGVGGVVPLEAYGRAARDLARRVAQPAFFVFSTAGAASLDGLELPGPVRFLTPGTGFESALDVLWLLSRGTTFLIANSSLYWWGAWLAEARRAGVTVAAFDRFANHATIPDRWIRLAV